MRKSPKSRPVLTTGLTACLGLGCASAQRPEEPPPSPIPCPAGAAQTYLLHHTQGSPDVEFERATNGSGIVRNGEVLQVQLLLKWGDFPQDTPLIGRAWFGRDRVYGRLTQLLLPGGTSLPICLDLDFNGPGVPMRPKSTRTVAFINPAAGAYVVLESRKP